MNWCIVIIIINACVPHNINGLLPMAFHDKFLETTLSLNSVSIYFLHMFYVNINVSQAHYIPTCQDF